MGGVCQSILDKLYRGKVQLELGKFYIILSFFMIFFLHVKFH